MTAMARSIWSGAISFGLVNVPVKLFTAVRKKDVRFHQLHEKDGARIQQKRVCSLDGEEVPYEEIAKGYEIGKGQYVMIDPEELDALDPEATHTIDIEDFVELDQIDPLFYDSSYYLVPDERGGKAYRLLLEAMQEANRVGIATVVMRTKQYLVAVRPLGNALVMSTMNFADEVVPQEDLEGLPTGRTKVSDRELKMANQLIDSLAGDFDPEKYKDTYREQVLDLIEKKAEGQEIVAPAAPERPAPVVDLMAALEASLAAAKGGRTASADEDKPRKATKKAAKKKAS
jgi:DNA end-binding protein Ku